MSYNPTKNLYFAQVTSCLLTMTGILNKYKLFNFTKYCIVVNELILAHEIIWKRKMHENKIEN